jgi:excisionase family DNA binding protein
MKKNRSDKTVDDLISISEAARLRDVTHGAIQDLIARGKLSVVVIAGRRLLRRSDVENFEPGTPGRKQGKK